MFGSDFTRFNKEEEIEVKSKPKQKTFEESRIDNNNPNKENSTITEKKQGYNYTLKALLYFANESYITKFLDQFNDVNKPLKFYIDTIGADNASVDGNYNKTKINIAFFLVTNKPRFDILQEMFNRGAFAVLMYFDSDDKDFILKITTLVKKIKSYSDAKFILVLDKINLDDDLGGKIKTLQDKNLIQGIYQFSSGETNNNDRLVADIVKITGFAKTHPDIEKN